LTKLSSVNHDDKLVNLVRNQAETRQG